MLTQQQNRMFAWSLHLAGAAVVLLVLGGFYALVYQPLECKNVERTERSEQLDVLLVQTGPVGGQYRRLRSELAKMKTSVAELESQFEGAQSGEEVIENISQLATDVNLEILDYQIGLAESLPTHSQIEVAFRCRGAYASICRFLEKTEHLTKTTKLSKFELDSSSNSGSYPIQLTFVLYSEAKSHDTKERRGVHSETHANQR